jgi:hypothetical protein
MEARNFGRNLGRNFGRNFTVFVARPFGSQLPSPRPPLPSEDREHRFLDDLPQGQYD